MIWNPFTKKNKDKNIGIDIGTSSIKVVELTHENNEAWLTNYALFYADLGERILGASPQKMNKDYVVEILKNLFASSKINPTTVSMSMPVFSSFSVLIDLPQMSEKELDQAVRYEARKHIPIPMSEVQFDWVDIEHLGDKKNKKVLTVAISNEVIKKYYNIAEALGVTLGSVELETFSTARSLLGSDQSVSVIVDIGSRTTNIALSDGGIVVVHHNMDTSGLTFTNVLARGLHVEKERAEEIKKENGLSGPNNDIAKLIYPFVDKIVFEIQQVMHEHAKRGGKQVTRILLTGGSSRISGLKNYIEQETNIRVDLGNPFSFVGIQPDLSDSMQNDAPELATAVGLALRK